MRRKFLFVLCVAALVILWLNWSKRHEWHKSHLLSSGSGIFNQMGAYDVEFPTNAALNFLMEGEFSTSTDFIRACYTNGLIELHLAYFALPGIPPFSGHWPNQFSSSNNAWCVVTPMREEPRAGNTPYLFTRNIEMSWTPKAVKLALESQEPFGGKIGAVVRFDGRIMLVQRGEEEAIARLLSSQGIGSILLP
jgi:hypothetical protein